MEEAQSFHGGALCLIIVRSVFILLLRLDELMGFLSSCKMKIDRENKYVFEVASADLLNDVVCRLALSKH